MNGCDPMMDSATITTEYKLLRLLMQLKRLELHRQPIANCKPSEIRVLFCIKKSTHATLPEIKVSEISRQLQVTSPTITQLLKGLEANGLIERHIDNIDRRSVGVKLTPKGEAVTQQAMDTALASMHELIEYLGEEQSNQLVELLSKVFIYFSEKEANATQHALWNGEDKA
jgi:DNA-binding MarR family transcriptional regulator